MKEFIEFWQDGLKFANGLCYHREDEVRLKENGLLKNIKLEVAIEEMISKDYSRTFEFTLVPTPYSGDLTKAKIFILMLNPGLSFSDFHMENDVPGFKEEVIAITNQNGFDTDFPFLCLNPKYSFWSGFGYWHARLHPVIKQIQEKNGCSYMEAMSILAQQIAVIQYVPYHSLNFAHPLNNLSERFPSVNQVKNNVQSLVQRSKNQKILIIVGRSPKRWGLSEDTDNIVVNKNRAFHLDRVAQEKIIALLQ